MRVQVTNTGSSAGDEVAQLYARDDVASITRPEKELRGVRRISLAPAQPTTVTFGLTARDLAFYDADMQRVVEPGTFTLFVGAARPTRRKRDSRLPMADASERCEARSRRVYAWDKVLGDATTPRSGRIARQPLPGSGFDVGLRIVREVR